jgi:hypothetical protein
LGASRRSAAGPGFTLVSFLPPTKKDTASIPCAGIYRRIYRKVESNRYEDLPQNRKSQRSISKEGKKHRFRIALSELIKLIRLL